MTEQEVLNIFKKTNALLNGHFKLSSGLHSEGYLQCALVLQYPEYAEKICGELAGRFREKKPTVVIGPALGGVIVSYEVARAVKCRSLFAERENDKMTLRRGFEITSSDRVLVVEDVITTGGSTREVIDAVKSAGASIIGVGSIIDRSCGAVNFEVEFKSLVKISVSTFELDKCPLCEKGIPLTKPGSRKA
ncbi:MAG: orotate phosphoribosyltransferase [Candidatus Omnitrophica bacterium]|nr:orotate phosphoribosyltransferase [Candidatus Omnitrophota bacterium]